MRTNYSHRIFCFLVALFLNYFFSVVVLSTVFSLVSFYVFLHCLYFCFMSELWIFVLLLPLGLCKMSYKYNSPFSSDCLLSSLTCTHSSFSSSSFMICCHKLSLLQYSYPLMPLSSFDLYIIIKHLIPESEVDLKSLASVCQLSYSKFCLFVSNRRVPFNNFCNAGLVVVNSLSLCLSGIVCISFSYLKDDFAGYIILSLEFLNIFFHPLLFCNVYTDKSDNNLIRFPLQVSLFTLMP